MENQENLHWYTTDPKTGEVLIKKFLIDDWRDILKITKSDFFFITQDKVYKYFINKINWMVRNGYTVVAVKPNVIEDHRKSVSVYFDYDMGQTAYQMEMERFFNIPINERVLAMLP